MARHATARPRRLVAGLLALGAALAPLPTHAARPYYAGKTVEIVVPFGPGGGTDVWARFVAPYLQKHVPGNPRVIVKNIPGGESITGANAFADSARPDGLALLATSATTAFHYLLGRPQVRYDFAKLTPVIVTATGGVIYAAPRAGIRTPADLLKPAAPLVYGGISATGLDLVTLLSFELLKLDVRVVLGFEGRGPARLAFERGETTIDYQTTTAYQTQVVPLVAQGKATPLMSFGLLTAPGTVERDPTVPDLPTVPEVYQQLYKRPPSGEVWRAYLAFMAAGFAYQKALWAPDGTPREALEALYEGARQLIDSAEFKEKSRELMEGYPTYPGNAIERAVREALTLPDDVRAFARTLVSTKYGVKF
ncbi:MAG TPA: hypothetical protein VNM66_05300 [Thermodesulfobacteriota bacterium]|nr:hypothetical protein [Thermodesulfobacteriota bacterium]